MVSSFETINNRLQTDCPTVLTIPSPDFFTIRISAIPERQSNLTMSIEWQLPRFYRLTQKTILLINFPYGYHSVYSVNSTLLFPFTLYSRNFSWLQNFPNYLHKFSQFSPMSVRSCPPLSHVLQRWLPLWSPFASYGTSTCLYAALKTRIIKMWMCNKFSRCNFLQVGLIMWKSALWENSHCTIVLLDTRASKYFMYNLITIQIFKYNVMHNVLTSDSDISAGFRLASIIVNNHHDMIHPGTTISMLLHPRAIIALTRDGGVVCKVPLIECWLFRSLTVVWLLNLNPVHSISCYSL